MGIAMAFMLMQVIDIGEQRNSKQELYVVRFEIIFGEGEEKYIRSGEINTL
jgi:hypothetical protein